MNIRKPHLKSIKFNDIILELTSEQLHQNNDINTAYILDYFSYQTIYNEPTTYDELNKIYHKNLVKSAKNPDIKYIHIKLIGTNNLKFTHRTSFYALINSLSEFNKESGQVNKIKLFLNNIKMYEIITRELYILNALHAKFNYSTQEISEIAKYYTVTPPDFSRKQAFTLGYMRNFAFSNAAPISKITDHLYLSRIPLADDAINFIDTHPNLKVVIAVLEDFEMVDKSLSPLNIASPEIWESKGIKHIQIPVRNTNQHEIDLPINCLFNILADVNNVIKHNRDVLIYCKTGTNRSGLVAMAYLKIYGDLSNNITPNDSNKKIYEFIRSKRPQVILNENHFNVIDSLIKLVESKKNLDQSIVKGESDTKIMINAIDEVLKSFSGKEAIIQMTSVKKLKALALDNPSRYLSSVNDFLAGLCIVNSLSELKQLISLKDDLDQYKINIYQEIIDLVASHLNINSSALVSLTQLRKNDPIINESLEPRKSKFLKINYAKILLIFTDPDKGLMLLVENKSLEKGSIRIFNNENNNVVAPFAVVSSELKISFTALNELVNKIGLNYETIKNKCPHALFYYISTMQKEKSAFHSYCLDLGNVAARDINNFLNMSNLVLSNKHSGTEYGFINLSSLENNSYCFGSMPTPKKLDGDDLSLLQKIIASKQAKSKDNWQSHIEAAQKSLSFFSPDCNDLDKMIKTTRFGSLRLQEFLSFVDSESSNFSLTKFSLKDVLTILSPHDELLRQDDIPVFRNVR